MEARTRDLLFGTGRTREDLQGVFRPRGWGGDGEVLATFRGFGPNGRGRERGLDLAERLGLISAEQRAAAGTTAAAGGERSIARGFPGPAASGAAAAADAAAVLAQPRSSNPIYGGLLAQSIMAETGFIPPADAPESAITAVDDQALALVDEVVPAPAPTGATQLADDAATLDERLIGAFERLGQLPEYEQKVSALGRAVDTTAAAGLGGDAFDVLAQSLTARPGEAVIASLDEAVAAVAAAGASAAPGAGAAASVADGVAADVATAAAPVADDLAHAAAPAAAATVQLDDLAELVARAASSAVEAAVPRAVEAALPRMLLTSGDDALRGVMPFAAGVDDTLRMLARVVR
jgi:hypothetical protein